MRPAGLTFLTRTPRRSIHIIRSTNMYPGTEIPRVGVFGGLGVGKSTLTMAFCQKHPDLTYEPTVEEDCFRTGFVLYGEEHLVEILDTAGQEEFANMVDEWIQRCAGFILVFDLTSKSSFLCIDSLLERILQVKRWTLEDPNRPDRLPIAIVANKTDLRHQRVVSTKDGQDLGKKNNSLFFEASAKRNVYVYKVFHDVFAYLLLSSRQSFDDASSSGSGISPTSTCVGCCTIM
ncbi:putative small G-protein Ras2 [Xylariaceae sp. FL0255]|nr:putative small G-protein Ras2 [Xylariaceae sp. FL0255]